MRKYSSSAPRKLIRNVILKSGLVLSLILVQGVSAVATSKLSSAKEFFQNKEYQKAHEQLNNIPLSDLDPKRMALIEFFRAMIFFEQNNYNFSIKHFDKSIKLGSRLEDVAQFYRGLSYLKLSNNKMALKSFRRVGKLESSGFLKEKSNFHLAGILLIRTF